MRRLLILMTVLSCLFNKIEAQTIKWVSSTNTDRWCQEKNLKFNKSLKDVTPDILIGEEKAQPFDGFGGTFNEQGWDALSYLSQEDRNEIILNLFSTKGANLVINRMPMGASDFGLSFYSYNDVIDDLKMINFNIHRDRYILIPYIKAAMSVNENIKIWASPWSPPAWMKTNNHYASNMDESGPDVNGLSREKILELPTTGFKMQRGYLEAYALYFLKFVQAYQKEGIHICAVNVQNEPCSNHKFPSCNWRAEDLTYFIGQYLGPTFEAAKCETAIYFGTINRDNPNYTKTALDDKQASKYIDGVGLQWDGKWAIPAIHKEYPTLKLMQTETECGNGDNDWNAAEYTWGSINHFLRNGVFTYAYWNMVLDHNGVSNWGWKQNSLLSINTETKEVVYNPEYFLMKHVSHSLAPGAYFLPSNSDDHIAFLNSDGSVIVIVVNRTNSVKDVVVNVMGNNFASSLKPHSFNTFTVGCDK